MMLCHPLHKAWSYAVQQCWELPASVLESITLVLVVFVQDVAFKESVLISALLLTVSFGLHGLACRAKQCQVWPKVIEIAAPVLFYGMMPAAYLVPAPTQRAAFIIINFWFVLVEVVAWAAGRNFMAEYFQDWNPPEVWGTPLLCRCATVVAISWIACQTIMGLAQVFVVIFNISLETNTAAAVMMCYIMQLLPLLWAVVFTFAYPAWLQKRWGYVRGIRETCYPPPHITQHAGHGDAVLSHPAAAAASAADRNAIDNGLKYGSSSAQEEDRQAKSHWLSGGKKCSAKTKAYLQGGANSSSSQSSLSGDICVCVMDGQLSMTSSASSMPVAKDDKLGQQSS